MAYRIRGEIVKDPTKIIPKTRPYISRRFKTQEAALKHAYSKVYRKDGNTKKTRNFLQNFYVEEVK